MLYGKTMIQKLAWSYVVSFGDDHHVTMCPDPRVTILF